MKERINWIDWAKAMAVTTVVFCHLPQSQEWFYYRYLQSCIITIFFFLSGYLKKDRGSNRANWSKYWHGLILPYIIYNLLVYPFWLLKYYMMNGCLPDVYHAARPLIGALLLQYENTFAEPLNGPLWYLPAILLMHVTIDLCRKTRYLHHIMIGLCVASFFLYAANKYYLYAPQLTPLGVIRRLPYYYLGYVIGRHQLFSSTSPIRHLIGCILCLTLSLLLFQWHLHENTFLLHIALFYPVNIGFLFGVLYACKLLNHYHANFVTNLSIGTLIIIGLHAPCITTANYLIERQMGINDTFIYQWYEALPLAILIVAMLYPAIVIARRHLPQLLGQQSKSATKAS